MSTTFQNLEQVEASIKRGAEERQEQEQELRQAHKDEKAILNAIQEEKITIRLKGKRMKFSPLMGDEEDFLDDLAAKYGSGEFADVDGEDELSGDDLEQYKSDRTRIVDILDDHNLDEGKYGLSFWKKLPQQIRFEALNKIREGGEETARAGN